MNGKVVIYLNDGSGNFLFLMNIHLSKRSFIGQIDNDSDIESISAVGVYNSQHLGSENSSLKIIDKIDNTYTEMISDQIYLNPKQGKEIFYRSIIDLEIHDFDSINDIIIWLSQEEMYENFFDDNEFIGNTKTSSVDDLGFESNNILF